MPKPPSETKPTESTKSEPNGETKPFEDVYVRAVAITRGPLYLMIFNEKWGGFTFPMSKKRPKDHPRRAKKDLPRPTDETAQETGNRVVVEALGRPLRPHERPRLHPTCSSIECYVLSGRDNKYKLYHIDFLALEVGDDEVPRPLGGLPVAWMTLDEIRADEEEHQGLVPAPLTTTATFIANEIREASEG